MNFVLLLFLFIVSFTQLLHADKPKEIANPCTGYSELLSVLDRPTVADSSCVVPNHEAVIEMGYQYLDLTKNGYGQLYPETEVRLGLPCDNEIRVLLPNRVVQTSPHESGSSAYALGYKHQIGYTEHWIWTIDALLIMPSGSASFGSYAYGYFFGGIAALSLNEMLTIEMMLSLSSLTQASSEGGRRYFTVNPDIVMTYLFTKNIQLFAELYGQSQTGPGEKPGFNIDGGIQYLINPSFEIDVEIGQRISGDLFGFKHYIGFGIGLLFK